MVIMLLRDTAKRVRGNRRAAFLGCDEKTAKSEGIIKPAAIQMRIQLGSLNVGTMSGKGVEVVEMKERRRLEVLCVHETKWRGDRARMMVGGRNLLHAGGDGRSSGVDIVISEEISKEVVRVGRWKGLIIMAWAMIRKQLVCVMSVYGPQTGRTEAEKQEFRDALEMMLGMVELETLLCSAGYFKAILWAIPSDTHQLQLITLHHFKLERFKSI